jgi:hypothetical protein
MSGDADEAEALQRVDALIGTLPTAEHRLCMVHACVRALTNRRLTSAERLLKGAQESHVNASASTSASAAATNAAMLTMPSRNADAKSPCDDASWL